ncbi:hypothetical protein [Verrucomicrobium spinosum]|uniref:hypothetical protein n=1 Tax=Verrucomicrobium spinosum TaxID=2736 RepID=UPI000946463A|nr:hypothetical protein [Verrucomicrobium spinosum]
MSTAASRLPGPVWLGIETGATHTTVLSVRGENEVIDRFDLGPANIRLATSAELIHLFESIRDRLTIAPSAIGGGFAGLRNEDDRRRVVNLVQGIWPDTPFLATDDLETALEPLATGRMMRRPVCFC